MYYIDILLIFVSLENGLLLFIVIPPVFFCVTHLSMEVNAVCGLLVPKSWTSSSYSVQLDSKAHTADYVLTSCQHSTSTMSYLSSRSATSSESDDSSECTVKGISAVLQLSQLTSKNSHSFRIHYVTTKRHAMLFNG
jgi:hypothetical protein